MCMRATSARCSVTLPDNAMTDTQVSAEYAVNAIRRVRELSGRKVDVIGHSQGGTEPRFALRFWPDLRDDVDDYVGLGATNHGSVVIDAMCVPGCSESLWQQRYGSNYTRAMNSYQQTFPGISYTQIYTRTDEFVQPNLDDSGTTSLHGGGGAITNVALQDIAPRTWRRSTSPWALTTPSPTRSRSTRSTTAARPRRGGSTPRSAENSSCPAWTRCGSP
ncbi:lipase family alpha/beta hydrolase [Amycolatopsis sp. MEPSY49]|uniref:lipase family alpha/beta hydrolase n=1 Tax=Amycolatopsis sp. MEPSY49 TaxID=3151600 RepID=UPI003EF25240